MQDSMWNHSSPASKENEIEANGLCSLTGIQTTERGSILKFPKYCGYWISTKRVCVSGLMLKPADLLLFRPQIVMTSVMLEVLRPQVPKAWIYELSQVNTEPRFKFNHCHLFRILFLCV